MITLLLLLLMMMVMLYAVNGYENVDAELLSAAEEGDTLRASSLLDKGANIDCRNNYGTIDYTVSVLITPHVVILTTLSPSRSVCSALRGQ